jgi:hypothetical protein
MPTPPFLLWSLETVCAVRGLQTGSDPERTERQLRAVAAVSDARREGRVFEGHCVAPPDGFRIDAALAMQEGLAAVEAACGRCPANAGQTLDSLALAGCFGIVPITREPFEFYAEVDAAIERLDLTESYQRLFLTTQPRWFGLWSSSPLQTEQLLLLSELLKVVNGDEAWQHLQAALQVATTRNLPLHIRLYPAGEVAGRRWRLAPHCPRCVGPWNDLRSRCCGICGLVGHPAPDKKRLARGQRPYFPLARLLGEQAAAEFLVRYEAFQKQRGSMPPAEIQPLTERPDSPPAG